MYGSIREYACKMSSGDKEDILQSAVGKKMAIGTFTHNSLRTEKQNLQNQRTQWEILQKMWSQCFRLY